MNFTLFYLTLLASILAVCQAATKDKPHGHQGVLKPYNGKQLSQKVTKEQEKKLENGESIMINKRDGKTGMGMCIADINSPPNICTCCFKSTNNDEGIAYLHLFEFF